MRREKTKQVKSRVKQEAVKGGCNFLTLPEESELRTEARVVATYIETCVAKLRHKTLISLQSLESECVGERMDGGRGRQG